MSAEGHNSADDVDALRRRQAELLAENEAQRAAAARLRQLNAELSTRIAALEKAGVDAREARRATLNVLEDAIASHRLAERLNERLQLEVQERRLAEAALRESNQRLQEALGAARDAHRAKDQFIAALSHELRTPLTPVLLLASHGATDPSLAPETRETFELVRSNVETEARLIDDLLDQSRVSRGDIRLCIERVNLHAVIDDALRVTRPEFTAKQIELAMDRPPEPRWIDGDAIRLQQILWNLLRNAAKFTPEQGRVAIQCVQSDPACVAVRITDSGIGLAPGDEERIFLPFVQGDQVLARSHRYGGLGLGLSISKQLVDLHHGRLHVTSPGLGQGCTFTLELPVNHAEAALPACTT